MGNGTEHQDLRGAILNGIRAELEYSTEQMVFTIEHVQREDRVWRLRVHPKGPRARVDDALEEAAAWWPKPEKGTGEVLAAVPEDSELLLHFVDREPPGPNNDLFVYPHNFLESLHKAWSDTDWAARCLSAFDEVCASPAAEVGVATDPKLFAGHLRTGQRGAFRLTGHRAGFLWGPPGTGKTYTIGALLSSFLRERPAAKVLLLSTTNGAVDLALTAVDRALEGAGPSTSELRKQLKRIGSHFHAREYAGREHLLARKDPELVRRLADLQAKRPDPADAEAFKLWKDALRALRAEMRQSFVETAAGGRLLAMTCTRAAIGLDDLRSIGPFDLVVFDEASQVGRAHAIGLLPLGRQVLFAGDPLQLSPVVQSKNEFAQEWMGTSMFEHMADGPNRQLLDEQSRMAEPICRVIGNVFYEGKLRVAADKARDPQWLAERRLASEVRVGSRAVTILTVEQEGQWSQRYGGPIRFASADEVQDVVSILTQRLAPKQILVATPFRAQRTILRERLRTYVGVTVSTVHRAQGTEYHTVIFDPGQGDHEFLRSRESRRIVNVALSRAKARLIVLLSPGDRRNPLLAQIASIVENATASRVAPSICRFVRAGNFPQNAIGQEMKIDETVGRVTGVMGDVLHFSDYATGRERKYKIPVILENCRRGVLE